MANAIRTKAQNKIDNRIKLFFDHGSCDVWVKESNGVRDCCPQRWIENTECMDEEAVKSISGQVEQKQLSAMIKSGTSPPIQPDQILDPLIADLINRSSSCVDHVWVDPIVIDETAKWLMVVSPGISKARVEPPPLPPL